MLMNSPATDVYRTSRMVLMVSASDAVSSLIPDRSRNVWSEQMSELSDAVLADENDAEDVDLKVDEVLDTLVVRSGTQTTA